MLKTILRRRELLAWIPVALRGDHRKVISAECVVRRPGILSGRTVAYLATVSTPDALRGPAPPGTSVRSRVQQNAILSPLDELNRSTQGDLHHGWDRRISDAVKTQTEVLPWTHTTTRLSGNETAMPPRSGGLGGDLPGRQGSHPASRPSNDLPNGPGAI
jgi:hypothetical protein